MYYIYEIKNLINGKTYIGQRKCPDNKIPSEDSYMGSGKLIIKAIEKYGVENFTKRIIAICEIRKVINELEKIYIALYRELDKAEYNIANGGEGLVCSGEIEIQRRKRISEKNKNKSSWNKGRTNVYSKETLMKMSKSHKGCKISEETKRKISESNKGKLPSEECIKRVIESHKGKLASEETRLKMSKSHKGKKYKPMSEQGRRNIGEAGKGRIPWNKDKHGLQKAWNKGLSFSDEWRRKLSESHKGKPSSRKGVKLSDEIKMKISNTLKEKYKENLKNGTV